MCLLREKKKALLLPKPGRSGNGIVFIGTFPSRQMREKVADRVMSPDIIVGFWFEARRKDGGIIQADHEEHEARTHSQETNI